jgi:flagellar biogenesis protein FliO
MDILRQAGALLLVFALLGGMLWLLRRTGAAASLGGWRRAPGRERSLASIERLALTPQHSLHLVRIGGREVMVATFPSGCSLLTEVKKELEP